MSTINYKKLTEIVVKSQEEFSMIPDNFQGRIYIEFETPWDPAIINRTFVRSVEAAGNTQVVNCQPTDARIEITGNARIVYNPKTIKEYMSFYDIKHDKKTGRFFKAVRRWDDGTYHSDHDSNFCYVVGKTVTERCDPDVKEDCSYGIHMSHLAWALGYGDNWKNIAILELE